MLVHDAAYNSDVYERRQGWGHSTPSMAAENALKAKVKRLYLTHYDPDDSKEDIEEKLSVAKNIFKNSYLAKEKLTVDILKI